MKKILLILIVLLMAFPVSAVEKPEIQLDISDVGRSFSITVENHRVKAKEGIAVNPDAIITTDFITFVNIFESSDKQKAAYDAYKQGKVRVQVLASYNTLLKKGYNKMYQSFVRTHPDLT